MSVPVRYWTREWIIDACREWNDTHGAPPKSGNWEGHNDHRFPSQRTVQDRFGSWNAMLAAAGFEPREKKTATLYWTAELILDACREFARIHGRAPFASEWRTASFGFPTTRTVTRGFGSWNGMLVAAGFEARANNAPIRWSKDAIAAAMLDWLLRTGKWPSCRDWHIPRAGVNPAHSTVFRVFPSWKAAKLYAGWDGRKKRAAVVEFRCSGCDGFESSETIGCNACWDRKRHRAKRAAKNETLHVSAVESPATGDSCASQPGRVVAPVERLVDFSTEKAA